jgi:hypothetical protein
MTKQIEYREDCFETIRECIKGKMSLKATIDECIKTYPKVHKQTFYKWYEKVKKEDEIEEWENANFMDLQNRKQEKIAFKERLFQDAKADYEKHYDLQEDIKVIMALRSECLSHLKHII